MEKDKPKNLQTALGKEFYNMEFKKSQLQKFNINHYSTYSCIIVERVNRTLETRMWKLFSFQGTYKWIDILQNSVEKYNNTIHRTIGMKPKGVKKKNEKFLLDYVYSLLKSVDPKRVKFQINN